MWQALRCNFRRRTELHVATWCTATDLAQRCAVYRTRASLCTRRNTKLAHSERHSDVQIQIGALRCQKSCSHIVNLNVVCAYMGFLPID